MVLVTTNACVISEKIEHKHIRKLAKRQNHLLPGNPHEVLLDLEGMGGGGKIQLEVC